MHIPGPPQPEVPAPNNPSPGWQSSIGGSMCPNGHFAAFDAKHCPECGAGPVPGFVDWESRDKTNRLGAKGNF